MDNRTSSRALKEAFATGVLSTGLDVVDIGVNHTPLLYFATAHWKLDGGATITGSHNPVSDNGVKMVHAGAAPLTESEIQGLLATIQAGDFERGVGTRATRDPRDEYWDAITSRVSLRRRLKVVVDAGNGIAGVFAPELLRRLGCEVVELYCESDGTFPNHLPDPEMEENMRDLVARTLEVGADVGVAYDGDADRVGIVDERGRRHEADLLLALLAASVANRTDLLLLGYWWPSSDVGIYAAAFQTATVLTVILGCLESIATPYLSESVAASDWKHTNILYGTVVRWSCVCALPLCLIMLLFPAQILSIFGPTFQAGAGCLIILACGHLINAVTACANNALLWAGHSRRVMWNYLIVAAAQIAADLALIPRYGMVGAACGAFFGLLLMNWLRTWQASHLIGIHPFPATLTKPLAAGAAGVVFLLGVRWLLPQAGPFPQVMLLLGSYVGVLLLLGLEQDDLRVCRQLPLIGGVVR